MTEQMVLSMDEPKQKLVELETHLPDATNDQIYGFGRFLAERLNPELIPQGFVLVCELALQDLQAGVDGFTGRPIQSRLAGYPPMIYALLRSEVATIAKAIFPEEFAKVVETFVEEMNQQVQGRG